MNKQNKTDKRETLIEDATSPAKISEYKATPVANNCKPIKGLYLPSYKIGGDVMPKQGDKITVVWNDRKVTGLVSLVFNTNTVLLYSGK